VRLGTWHRRLLVATLSAVAATGVLWFLLHDVMDREPDEVLRTLLVAHGVIAFASAIAFGSVLPLHVLAGWRQRRNRLTGLAVALTVVLLIASALLLYYGGEETRAWARLIHLAVGFAAIVAVPLHVVLGRRLRNQRERGGTSREQEW